MKLYSEHLKQSNVIMEKHIVLSNVGVIIFSKSTLRMFLTTFFLLAVEHVISIIILSVSHLNL